MLPLAAVSIAILAVPIFSACSAQPGETPTVPVAGESPVPEAATSEATAATAKPREVNREVASDKIGGGCEVVKKDYLSRCAADPQRCGGKPQGEVSAGAYGSVLNRGSYLNRCGAPATMSVTICAAVIEGSATGVTVTTNPYDPAVGRCVATAISQMAFPPSPSLDVTMTTFAAQ